MRHHLDHSSASDLSYLVFQERRRRAEIGLEPMHPPYQGVERRAIFNGYAGERAIERDSFQGEHVRWPVEGKR